MYRNRRICAFLSAALLAVFLVPSPAYADQKSDLAEQKAGHESELSETRERLNSLAARRETLIGEIDELNADLVDLMVEIDEAEADIRTTEEKISETESSIASVQADIDVKQAEIAQTESDLAAAEEKRDRQYENMKKRIRYIYENGGDAGWALKILESDDLTSFINNTEYTENLEQTDRAMLEDLKATVSEIADLEESLKTEKSELEAEKASYESEKAGLEEQKATLEAQKADLEAEKAALDQSISEKEAASEDYASRIEEAKAQASELTSIISEENEEMAKLDAEEQAAAVSASVSSASGSTDGASLGRKIVSYAEQFVGNPYVWGGSSLTNGCDCSHFVWLVLLHTGAYSGGYMTSGGWIYAGEKVSSLSEARAGDIICYPHHVAIYDGNGMIVEAKGEAYGITHDRTADHAAILAIRRFT